MNGVHCSKFKLASSQLYIERKAVADPTPQSIKFITLRIEYCSTNQLSTWRWLQSTSLVHLYFQSPIQQMGRLRQSINVFTIWRNKFPSMKIHCQQHESAIIVLVPDLEKAPSQSTKRLNVLRRRRTGCSYKSNKQKNQDLNWLKY